MVGVGISESGRCGFANVLTSDRGRRVINDIMDQLCGCGKYYVMGVALLTSQGSSDVTVA